MEKTAARRLNAVRWALVALGVGFVCLGVYRNEVRVVLTKAINICLECIGIG